MLAGLVRGPLYSPVLASALPLALTEAAQGRWEALLGLNAASGSRAGRAGGLASGMHFSVVCAEDAPRWEALRAPATGPLALYQAVCADWPRGQVPPAFYRIPVASVPTLLLSGGQDPATPPRHGERVAQALGPQAVHVVVPHAGHGVMAAVPCWREAVFRFLDAATASQALQQARADAACAADWPQPLPLLPLQAAPTAVSPGPPARPRELSR
jgi:pimeloyl-ACP methyl ester carboxylesterase